MTVRPYTAKGPSCQALLRASEVAERLSIGRSSVYRLAVTGELPAVFITPGCVRFRPDVVERFIRAREAATAREIHMSVISTRRSPATTFHPQRRNPNRTLPGNDPVPTAITRTANQGDRR